MANGMGSRGAALSYEATGPLKEREHTNPMATGPLNTGQNFQESLSWDSTASAQESARLY